MCPCTYHFDQKRILIYIMSEKFSLKWNDYQSNWNKAINELQTDTDFADVTLISDDKAMFSAHKILLSSCSNLFKSILKGNTQNIPLLYLGGVSSINLGFILNYIYQGEVNLYQEQLDSFIECAQKLEIDGLLDGNIEMKDHIGIDKLQHQKLEQVVFVPELGADTAEGKWKEEGKTEEARNTRRHNTVAQTDVAKLDVGCMTPEEIGKKIKELYLKTRHRKNSHRNWKCLKCDFISISKTSSQIRSHVETHLDGLCYNCELCSEKFKSRYAYYSHKRNHKRVADECLKHETDSLSPK